MDNPFDSNDAVSNCTAFRRADGILVHLDGAKVENPQIKLVHEFIVRLVLKNDYPCTIARGLVSSDKYIFGVYHDLSAGSSLEALCRDLWSFIQEFQANRARSFFASFLAPEISTEEEFEAILWGALQKVHDCDCKIHTSWPSRVSSDPENPAFAFCVAGFPFLVLAGFKGSSRRGRAFEYPTLTFNPLEIFEGMQNKSAGDTTALATAARLIRARDADLHGGAANPNQIEFGAASQAKKFSGRTVEDGWKCPFKPNI